MRWVSPRAVAAFARPSNLAAQDRHLERRIPFDADVVKMADVLSCSWLGACVLRYDRIRHMKVLQA